MTLPFHFLSFLIISFLLPGISHSQYTQTDLPLNETKIISTNETMLFYKMNLSRSDLDTFKYIVIKTNPDDYTNPAHLYISQSSYYPSNSNYDFSSHKEGENMIYMDSSTLVEGVLYIGIICEDECKFGIQSYPSERLLLLDNYEEIQIIPTSGTTEFYFHPRADTDDMFVYVIGEKDENFEVTVLILNETDKTIIQKCEVHQCFYEGYGSSISLHNGTSEDTMILITVKMDIRTAKQKVTVGAVINDFIIPTNKMEQTFGIINNDVINEQCYMLVQEIPDKDIIFFIESHTHGVAFIVRNATDESYDIILEENVLFNNWTIVESNVLIGNIFCFKSPNETNTHNHITSYVFQYTYSEANYFINSQPHIDSLSEGVFYEHYIPPGLQTYYKRKLILPQHETVYANFIPLIGESKVYPYVCQSYPYCRVDNSIMEEIIANDNGEGYFNINNQVTFRYDTTSLSSLDNEKLVFVVKCSEDSISGCTYLIEIDNGGEIELLPNMNFVALSNRNNQLYFRTSNNYYINNLRFITTSLSGISSPDMDGINYKLESAGNKQIYHFVKQTSKRFKVNSLNFDSVYFAKFAFGETNDTLLTLNYTYTEFITFANEKKRFYVDVERDIESGNVVILNIKGVNCITKVAYDSNEYIANKTHEVYITQSPSEDIISFDLSVVAFDNNSTSTSEICVVHISAVDNQNTRGVSFFENEEHAFTMSDNKENNIRYFNFPVNFGKTKEQFPFHFLNFELSEQTHFELTLAVNSMNHVFAVYQLYKSDIFLLGNKLYENCRAFSEACLLVIKLEKIKDGSSSASTVDVVVTFNSKNERPIYLEKNKQIKQYMPNKPQAKFMYTDIGLNETGSITFNFQKQPNNIYASIFRKDKIYTYDWLGRLPLHYYYSEQLTYDVYSNSFSYNETQTSKCENGCELLVIYEQDKYINSKSIVINQFTVHIAQQDKFTHVLPNEDIQITFKSQEEKHFFRFVMPNDTDSPRLMVELDSNFGKLHINVGLDVPNDITYDYIVNSTDLNFIIDASDSRIQKQSLKGVVFTFYASLNTYIEGDSFIQFKLIPQYANSSPEFNVIRTTYSQHEVCRIAKDNEYCHFLMYIPDDLPIQRIYTYAESRLSPNFMLTTTSHILAKETVETQYYTNKLNIADLFPTKDQYDKKNNEQENYLEVMTDETAEPMVYVFISVYSEKATDIDFYVSNMVNVRQFQLSSNEKQLIYIPKETKSFWEVKPELNLKTSNVMLYSTVLHGTGLFTIVNQIGGDFIVHPKFSFSRGFDVFQGGDFVNLIDGDYGSSMLMLGSFAYFMYDRHLERLSMNYVNEYELSADNYPFQFYTPLSNEKTADLIIKFYNRFDYEVTNYDLPFQVTAALVSEEYLNSKRQGADVNVTKSLSNFTFVDTFDFALIRYHLDTILEQSINANKLYLFIEVQTKNYYTRLYNNSNLVIGLSSQQHNFRMTLPRGKYFYNTFDIADPNESEHVYIMNTGQLPKHTALQVDVGESVHFINNHEALSFDVEPNPDNPFCGANRMKNWNVTKQHINGKDVIIGYIGQTVCSEYIIRVKKHSKCKVQQGVLTQKIGYAVKFTTSSQINEHNYNDESLSTYAPRFKIEEGFNFTVSTTNSSEKNITLRTISYIDDDLYTPFYYIRVYTAKEVKHQSAVSSVFPIGIDDKEIVHPVYQYLFKTNNQSSIVTHLFELSGDVKDYYVSIIVTVKKGQDEQSIGVYKPFSNTLSTFVILIIVVAIVVVALVGVGGFFLYKFFLKLNDSDEKVVKEIDGVGSLIDPSNKDSIISNENPNIINTTSHEGETNQLDNDDNNQIAEI